MPDKTDDTQTEAKIEYRQPDGETTTIYSDVVHVLVNYNGFRLHFGTQRPRKPGEPLHIDARVAVGMSAEHAKSLCLVLERQLKRYEEEYGPIRSEPEKPKERAEQKPDESQVKAITDG